MTRSLVEILDEPDDARLCRDTAQFFFPPSTQTKPLKSLTRTQRVIRLVVGLVSLMESGGFRELFRAGNASQKGLALTIKSLRLIGCPDAADTVFESLSRFPDARLPEDNDERMRIIDSHAAYFVELLQRFRREEPRILHGLATFIRQKRDELLTSVASEPGKLKGSPGDLPHWARVLFAAKCAKVVSPLLRTHWPNLLPQRLRTIKRAIHAAARSAMEGAPHDGVARAATMAEQAAGAAHGGGEEPRSAHGISRTIASFVAKSAEKAAVAATLPPETSAAAVEESFRFAQSAAVAAGSRLMMKRLKETFSKLHTAAVVSHWTHATPISREVWDSL